MALQSRVDREASSRGIHTSNILTVVDLFKRKLSSVVPMVVVQMLSYKSVGLYCAIGVNLDGEKQEVTWLT